MTIQCMLVGGRAQNIALKSAMIVETVSGMQSTKNHTKIKF